MIRPALRLNADPALASEFLWQLEANEPKLLSLGSRADWSLAVPEMLPIAAKIYFDGQLLSIAALGTGATLDGQPLDAIFRPLTLPARLCLGKTAISLGTAPEPEPNPAVGRARYSDSETKEMAFDELYGLTSTRGRRSVSPPRPESATLSRAPAPRASFTDRLQALTTTRADPRIAPSFAELPTGALPRAPIPPRPRPAGSEPQRRPGPWRSFQRASFAKRATVVLLPFVIGLFGWKAVHRAPRSLVTSALQTSANSSRVAIETSSTAAADRDAPRVVPLDTLPVLPLAGSNKPANTRPPPRQTGLTLQRRAVDAFASGNFAEAADLYRRLASESPEQAAYAVASRIADDKAKGLLQ